MNAIDLAFIAVLGFGAFKGISSNFGKTFNFVILLLISGFGAILSSGIFEGFVRRIIKSNSEYFPFFLFLFLFMGIFMGLVITGATFRTLGKGKFTSVGRLGALITWLLFLIFGFSTMLYFGDQGALIPEDIRSTSIVYDYVEPLAYILFCKLSYLLPILRDIADALGKLASDFINAMVGTCYTSSGPTEQSL